jgi:hypothetical protein
MARRLFFPGYYSGFSNNRMSLDIAVALAYLTGRTLVPYRFRMPRRTLVDTDPGGFVDPVLLPELFEIPVTWSDEYLFKTWVSLPEATYSEWAPVYNSVLCIPSPPPEDDPRFGHFRNGRASVHSISEREEQASDLVVSTRSLGHYCHFFYVDDARRRELVELMRRLRPRQPYREAADRIAASLGQFNAIHIRRGDFVHNALSQEKITRAASISGQEIVANLASRMSRDEPLVVCTDGSSREELFGPIQKYFREVLFLDRYVRESAAPRQLVDGLPRADEGVDALLAQLVASQARVFAGTLFSTFTALIHRLRSFRDARSPFLYCYNDFPSPLVRFEACEFLPVDDGPFTWNRIRYPVSPDAYSWLREWPEAADGLPPPFESDPSPPGMLDLVAGSATLHGGLRLERADGQSLIGNWFDPQDCASWDVVLPESGTYGVEIRYACPMEVAGSEYRIGVPGADELQAIVWNTGHLASLSPWLPLGRLRLPAGRSTLGVRAIGSVKRFVMNLSGVRLLLVTDAR